MQARGRPAEAWQTIEITPDAIRGWERTRRQETNTGLRCGYLLGLDIDVRDGGLVHRLLDLASDTIGATPLMRIGQAPKTLLAYRTEMPFTKIKTPRLLMPDGQPALIECLATGQQFVGFGIHPGTRQPYHWPHAIAAGRAAVRTAGGDRGAGPRVRGGGRALATRRRRPSRAEG